MTLKGKFTTPPAWATAEELRFISGINSRSVMAGYLAGATRRTNWGAIDAPVVLDAAKRRLAWMDGK